MCEGGAPGVTSLFEPIFTKTKPPRHHTQPIVRTTTFKIQTHRNTHILFPWVHFGMHIINPPFFGQIRIAETGMYFPVGCARERGKGKGGYVLSNIMHIIFHWYHFRDDFRLSENSAAYAFFRKNVGNYVQYSSSQKHRVRLF